MRILFSCLFLIVVLSAMGECHHHHGEDIFKKLAEDIKEAAEKFAHDVKEGADDVAHVAKHVADDVKNVADKFGDDVKDAVHDASAVMKKFGDDVDNVIKEFREEIATVWIKAEPYLHTAFVVVNGVVKTLEEVEETEELFEILGLALE